MIIGSTEILAFNVLQQKILSFQSRPYPTDNNWKEWNITEESHQFFTLRWMELFDLDTHNTWQVRSSNITSILQELRDSAKTLQRAKDHHPNIDSLLSELKLIHEHDKVLKTYRPTILVEIVKLEKIYVDQIKGKDSFDVEQFLTGVSILESYIAGYASLIFDELKHILFDQVDNYKIDMHMMIMLLGVELKNRGFSIENLRASHSILIDDPTKTFLQRFECLITRFMQAEQQFDCVYLMRGPFYEEPGICQYICNLN
jgi:hypothetical protein